MTITAGILNGTNLNRDFHFQALISELFSEGVRKSYSTELEVQANLVKAGMCFVEVTRTSVSPNETFLIPVVVGSDVVVDTTGTGYAVVKLSQSKVNDGSLNAVDGTGIATVEIVASLPTDPYIQLASITGGVITDTRSYAKVKDNTNGVLDNIQSMIDLTIGSGNWKASVRVATASAGTLASSFENGDAVDGVTLATNDRILIKTQADAKENGIYTVNASGAPTRATDFNENSEISGAMVSVREGTTNADKVFLCTTDNPVLGTSTINWVERGTDASTIISDIAYNEISWNGVTNIGASKNAIRDQIETMMTDYKAIKSGVGTLVLSSSSNVVIAHGLGRVPRFLRINGMSYSCVSTGSYDGTTNKASHQNINNDTTGMASTAYCLRVADSVSPLSKYYTAVATFDATNITLTPTLTGAPTGNAYYHWEVN